MNRTWLLGLTGALLVAVLSAPAARADYVEYTFERPKFTFNEMPTFSTPITSAPNIGDPTFSASFIQTYPVGPPELIEESGLPPLSGQFFFDRDGFPMLIQFNQPVYGVTVSFALFDAPNNPFAMLGIGVGNETEFFAALPESGYQGGTATVTSSIPFTRVGFVAYDTPTRGSVGFGIDNLIFYTTPYVAPAPEPSTLALAGLGIASLGCYARRRRKPA